MLLNALYISALVGDIVLWWCLGDGYDVASFEVLWEFEKWGGLFLWMMGSVEVENTKGSLRCSGKPAFHGPLTWWGGKVHSWS